MSDPVFDPKFYRYPRTQSRQLMAMDWEERHPGLPEPLWKSIAAGIGLAVFIACLLFAL